MNLWKDLLCSTQLTPSIELGKGICSFAVALAIRKEGFVGYRKRQIELHWSRCSAAPFYSSRPRDAASFFFFEKKRLSALVDDYRLGSVVELAQIACPNATSIP